MGVRYGAFVFGVNGGIPLFATSFTGQCYVGFSLGGVTVV